MAIEPTALKQLDQLGIWNINYNMLFVTLYA